MADVREICIYTYCVEFNQMMPYLIMQLLRESLISLELGTPTLESKSLQVRLVRYACPNETSYLSKSHYLKYGLILDSRKVIIMLK